MKTAVIVAGVLRHCDVSSLSWQLPFEADFYLSTWDLTEYVYDDEFYPIDNELANLKNIDFKLIHIENYKKFCQTYISYPGFEISRVFYLVNKIYEQIKELNYDRIILIRSDTWLQLNKPSKLFDHMTLMNDYSVITSPNNEVDLNVLSSKEKLQTYFDSEITKNGWIRFPDSNFIFTWSAFEEFANIWTQTINSTSCPHTFLYKFFFLGDKITLSYSHEFFTGLNRAPLSAYISNNLDINSKNLLEFGFSYEDEQKKKNPVKSVTHNKIREYFKNNN